MVENDHFGLEIADYKEGDLHVHSGYNYGNIELDGKLQPYQLVDIAEGRGHAFLAIVDHDTVVPSLVGREYAAKEGYKVEVIPGKEVSSLDGHILALGIETNIPFWMSAKNTVSAIHAQGGKAIPAHPLFTLTDSLGEAALRQIVEDEDPDIYWDGVEVFNAGANDLRGVEWLTQLSDSNRKIRGLYRADWENGSYGAAMGGSDTHGNAVGRAVTRIPSALSLYEAIDQKTTEVVISTQREHHTVNSLRETRRKSKSLERYRRTLPTEARIFPME